MQETRHPWRESSLLGIKWSSSGESSAEVSVLMCEAVVSSNSLEGHGTVVSAPLQGWQMGISSCFMCVSMY